MDFSPLPALVVLSGLLNPATGAVPVPSLEVVETQLRAVNHRFVDPGVDVDGGPLQAWVNDDFRAIASDGAWLSRAEFIVRRRQTVPPPSQWMDAVQVRLFGAVALVHGRVGVVHGGARKALLRYTDVHVWTGWGWRLVSAHDTPIAPTGPTQAVDGAAAVIHVRAWQGQDPVGDDTSVLRALNQHYVQAFREADVAWYDAHLSPDYLVISGSGALNDRATALADFAKPSFATFMSSFPVDHVSVRRFGDIALIHAENAYELKDGRKGVSRYTDIWLKQAAGWKCIAAHITVHKPPS